MEVHLKSSGVKARLTHDFKGEGDTNAAGWHFPNLPDVSRFEKTRHGPPSGLFERHHTSNCLNIVPLRDRHIVEYAGKRKSVVLGRMIAIYSMRYSRYRANRRDEMSRMLERLSISILWRCRLIYVAQR